MNNEAIIKRWRSGLSVLQVAKEYMEEYNEWSKRRKEPKVTQDEALKHVESVIFNFETNDWRRDRVIK